MFHNVEVDTQHDVMQLKNLFKIKQCKLLKNKTYFSILLCFIYLFIYLFTYLFIYLFIYLFN